MARRMTRPQSLGLGSGDATGGNIVPADMMGGGVVVNVNVGGSVISERDLVRAVYDGIIAGPGQMNPSLWAGRA